MPKILVIDDEVRVRELLRTALSAKGYEAVTVPLPEQAVELVAKNHFDLIILDLNLSGTSGITILKVIRAQQKKVPVVIFSGSVTLEQEKEAMSAGADEILKKEDGVGHLAERIGKIIQAKAQVLKKSSVPKEKTILIVDDEEDVRILLGKFFERKGYKVFLAESGERAIEITKSEQCSAVLLDINMPGLDGIETLERLMKINPRIGVVMVTANQDNEKVKKALALGAYGYVLKPFDFLYLELAVTAKLRIAASD